MDISNSRVLVIGGAGLIGSHIVELLTKENVKEIIVYDNFCRGTKENLEKTLQD
ncbi:MAG: NAD-dependent dehydratase, partial [Elusimicrobia bacterium CG02_land_8_20_14_3_00_37_13]